MATITARKLSRETARVIDELAASGEPVLILRKGAPVAVLSAVDSERVEEAVVASTPEASAALARADEAAVVGETKSFAEIFGAEPSEDDEHGGGEDEAVGSVMIDGLATKVIEWAPSPLEGLPAERREHFEELRRQIAREMLASSVALTARCVSALSIGALGVEGEGQGAEALEEKMRVMLKRGEASAAEKG